MKINTSGYSSKSYSYLDESEDESSVTEDKLEDVVEATPTISGKKEPPKRYPRRSVATKNYKEQEVPKDDDYLCK